MSSHPSSTCFRPFGQFFALLALGLALLAPAVRAQTFSNGFVDYGDGSSNVFSAVTVGPDGKFYVLWKDGNFVQSVTQTVPSFKLLRWETGSSTWTSISTITADTATIPNMYVNPTSDAFTMLSDRFGLRIDSSGQYHIVISPFLKPAATIMSAIVYGFSANGTSWTFTKIEDNAGTTNYSFSDPQIELDQNQRPHIIHRVSDSSNSDPTARPTRIRHHAFNGSIWTSETAYERVGSSLAINSSVGYGLDSAGKVHLALAVESDGSGTDASLYYLNNTSGSWSSPVNLAAGSPGAAAAIQLDLVVDPSDKVHIVRRDLGVNLHYHTNKSGSWVGGQINGTLMGAMEQQSLTVNAGGDLLLHYNAQSTTTNVGAVSYACLFNGSSTWQTGSVMSGNGRTGLFTSVAFTSGHVAMFTFDHFTGAGSPAYASPDNPRQLHYATATIAPPGPSVPTVTTPTSASIGQTTATLGGNVTADGGGTVSERGVVYSVTATNSSPAINGTGVTRATTSGTTGVFTVAVTGLSAATAYSYKAYATNSAGTTYSSGGTFTTTTATPVINSSLAASGTYGTAASTYTITATNTPTSYNATGLPPGLAINTTNGQITGTPTTPVGSPFNVTITATNGGGTDSATLVYTVNKAVLSISGLAVNNKVYDGTTIGQPDYNSAALNGQVGSDAVQADVGAAVTNFANRNVGTGKIATVTGITLSGAQSARYTLTNPTATANITAKVLSISGVAGANRSYDGTTVATLTGTASFLSTEAAGAGSTSDGKPYSVDSVSVSGTATGAFTNKNIGTAKAVTVTGFTITGTGSSNYSVTQPTGLTANIAPKALTVSGLAASAKTYDGTTAVTVTGTASLAAFETAGSGTTSDGRPYTGDTVSITGTAASSFADRNAGTGKAITITGLSSSDANYTLADPALAADITAKALTVSGLAAVATRVYDGTTVAGLTGTAAIAAAEATGTGTTTDGAPYTVDSVSLAGTAAGAFADRHVATAKAITVSGLTVTGTGSANYTVSLPTGLTADITTKALSFAGLSAVATRVYDGSTVAGLTGIAAFLSAEAAGAGTTTDGKPYSVDTISVGGASSGAFADRHVGTAKAITVTGLTIAGTNAANYTATQPTGLSAEITPKALTIAGLSGVATRTYDGTTVAGLTGTAAFLSNEAAGTGTTSDGKPYSLDTLSVSGSAAGAFADRQIGTGKAITVTGLGVGGTDNANYTAVQPLGLTANVTAKPLTIAGVTAADRIYDATLTASLGGTAAFLSAEAAGAGTTSDGAPYSIDTIVLSGTAAGTFADKDVATGKAITITGLTVSGTDAPNYTVTQPAGLTAAVTKKNLSISGVNAASRVYNGTTSVSLSGSPTLQAAEAPGTGTTADGKPYTGDTFSAGGIINGTFADKDVGTGKIITVTGVNISGAAAGNYNVGSVTATADITPKALTISGVTAVTPRIYDGTTVAGLAGTAVFTAAEIAGTGSTSDGIPYTVDSVTVGGTAAGAFADRHVGTAKAITVSGLTVSGTGSANYTATQPTGLTTDITAKPLDFAGVTAVATRIYDGTTVAGLTGTAAFLAAEAAGAGTTADGKPYTVDTISVGGAAAGAFANRHVGTAKAITVTGLTVAGTDAANYSTTQPTGLTADVTAKALTLAGLSGVASRTYDATTTAGLTGIAAFLSAEAAGTGTTADGKPYSLDTLSVSGAATGVFATRHIGTAKTITVAGLGVGGTDSGNYTAVQPTGLTGNVTAKTLTLTGVTGTHRVYDATTLATLTGTAAFLAAETPGTGSTSDAKPYTGDAVTLGGTASATFATKAVGTGKVITVTGYTLGGAEAANYALTQPTGLTADITAKNLTVAGTTAASKAYDGNTAATLTFTGATLVGIAGVDTVTLVTSAATGAFANANAGLNKTVTIAGLTLGGIDASNYTVTQPTATASISPANVSVAISGLSHTYDGTPKSATVTVTPAAAAAIVYSNTGGGLPTNAGSYLLTVNITDNNYSGNGSATLTIAKATQTVAFSITGTNFAVGSSLGLVATASSGLPVTFSVVSGAAALSGSTATVTTAGATVLRAAQAGNDNYLPASADQGFTGTGAAKASQIITFNPPPSRLTTDRSFDLVATATSGLPVTFAVISGPAFLSSDRTLTLVGAPGTVIIRASQSGNAIYGAAPDVIQSFTITDAGSDTFFGDLVEDNLSSGVPGRGEIFGSGDERSVAAKNGDIAAVLFPGTRRGSIILVSPALNLNVSLEFTLNGDGTYTIPFTSAGRSLTLNGALTGSTLTGRIPTLRVSFTTTVQARAGITSGIAGYYESDSLNTATGGTASIVGPNGQILLIASTATVTTGALGTIAADGKFTIAAPGATIAGAVDAPTTSVSGTISVPGQPTVRFSGLSATTARTDRLINLSSRVRVGPAAGRTLITGFVIGGTESKRVLLRAVGPALTGFGVAGALANPRIQLFDGTGKIILENDDWSGADTAASTTRVGAFALAAGSKDAALFTTLAPGAYTMHVIDGGETGIALAEIYDASTNPNSEYQRLINISTRGEAGAGENVLIGGFIVTGNAPKRVLVRGIGPGLAAFGVAGTLADPRLRVFDEQGLVAENDNWSTVAADALTQAARDTGAFALPAGSRDAAMVLTLAPGAYTAQVGAADGTTGVALVEIYELP